MPQTESGGQLYSYDNNPDYCPLCHHGIESQYLLSSCIATHSGTSDILEIIFKCPRSVCRRVFIGRYAKHSNYRHQYDGEFKLKNTAPFKAAEPIFPEEVKEISPDYVELYTQSYTAELHQLNQICGVGYRKSLEYLIKDYAIYKNPADESKIKSIFLGVCIKDYVEDSNVKECAKRASWLGNDETHYVRKWVDKDINDMKILIKLTETWIQANLLTEKYLKEMA